MCFPKPTLEGCYSYNVQQKHPILLSLYSIYGCNTSDIMRHPFWFSKNMHHCINFASHWTAFVHDLCLHHSPSNRHAHTSACQGTHAKLWSLSKRMGGPCFEANDTETARWIVKISKRAAGSCVLQWCGWGQFEMATWTRNWFEAPINHATLSGKLDI